jgi:single-strand selective monofunctional uracil DNA glycosylase
MQASIPDALLDAAKALSESCQQLPFDEPVHTVYNAFGYAWRGYEAYLRSYARTRKRILYLGMNPGPWGMAQTGVPFGEIKAVREWMGLTAPIDKPPREHPKRPIEGFLCERSEVSGRRLWSLFADLYGTADAFFREALVFNYCPLSFMSESGANITPDKLSGTTRAPLEAACDAHLRTVIGILEPDILVGVGGFATHCLEGVAPPGVRVGTLLHPSPASPIANREWPQRPIRQLRDLGIVHA